MPSFTSTFFPSFSSISLSKSAFQAAKVSGVTGVPAALSLALFSSSSSSLLLFAAPSSSITSFIPILFCIQSLASVHSSYTIDIPRHSSVLSLSRTVSASKSPTVKLLRLSK